MLKPCRGSCLLQHLAGLLALWLHECSRVFEDRLTNDEDHAWFRTAQVGKDADVRTGADGLLMH